VSDNSIVAPLTAAPVPELISDSRLADGLLRIRHREYLGDLQTGTTTPWRGTYRLNPSDPLTFPWLSTLAQNFEQWVAHGIVFEFVSTCGNAVSSTNAALGSISLATQYNSEATAFSSKIQLLNHYFATSTKTAENLMHAIECSPDEVPTKLLYTGVPTPFGPDYPGDDRLYDLGFTTYWLQGSQSFYTAGELWVTYDVSLLKPRLNIYTQPEDSVSHKYFADHPQKLEVKEEEGLERLDLCESPAPSAVSLPYSQKHMLARYLPGYGSPTPSVSIPNRR
jgi:hypothetical protein